MSLIFENELCSRCCGTGEYSYCQSFGTTCFKCRGKKVAYTKRGQAAYNYFLELSQKPISSLKVGDIVNMSGIKGQVTEIKEQTSVKDFIDGEFKFDPNRISISIGNKSFITFKNVTVFSYENREENIQKALEYQSKLTKLGKLKKGLICSLL